VTHALTPYLSTRNASDAIAFYKAAFGAVETMRLPMPDGRIGHAEMTIGEAAFMLADEFPEMSFFSPQHLNGSPVTLHLTVPNVDELFHQAIAAGATAERPLKDEFYGMRTGTLRDPFGHRWMIGTVVEQLTNEEIERRAAAAFSGA
jgi:PhnB protein